MMKQEGRKVSVMYKSQLQEYAQKASIPPPVYEFVKEGASHEPRFKAVVILNNVTYESPHGYPNLKSAEHAAAKAALDGLLQSTGGIGVAPSPVHESGLCKNLLQEYAQKNSLPLPVYQSQRSGEDHAPTFTSSVEIAGVKYSGGSAKNKKDAEIKAARTALLAIQSAQASVTAPDPVTLSPQVGLATLISAHLNNTPGKKRGRGALVTGEEPNPGRLKVDPTVQLFLEAPSKVIIPPPEEKVTSSSNLAALSKPVAQKLLNPSPATSLDIAALFATPGAKKILGVSPKSQISQSPCLVQGKSLSPAQQNAESVAPSTAFLANSHFDAQGKGSGVQNDVAEILSKGEQSFIEASESAGLRSLAGGV